MQLVYFKFFSEPILQLVLLLSMPHPNHFYFLESKVVSRLEMAIQVAHAIIFALLPLQKGQPHLQRKR